MKPENERFFRMCRKFGLGKMGYLSMAALLAFWTAFRGSGPVRAEPDSFPKEVERRALAATILIRNPGANMEGSGVLVGNSGSLAYFLTAAHVVRGTGQL